MYTVKQLARLAGVSVRTLHYYDQIGLLKPEAYGENSYRYYGADSVLKLQQILFFRELDFSLDDIRTITARPGFNIADALHKHRAALQERARRLDRLIQTVDHTLLHLQGKKDMENNELFAGFSDEQQQEYDKEARRRWGDAEVDQTIPWSSYTAAQKAAIQAEGKAVYRDLAALIEQGVQSDDALVQHMLARWHQHMRYFYEPSVERLRGLSELYVADPHFRANFDKVHPRLAEFMRQAVQVYCARLEAGK